VPEVAPSTLLFAVDHDCSVITWIMRDISFDLRGDLRLIAVPGKCHLPAAPNAFPARQDTRLFNNACEIRNRPGVDDPQRSLSRLPGDLWQVSTGQDGQQAGCHGLSKRMPQRRANRPIDWARNMFGTPPLAGVFDSDLGAGLPGIGDQSLLMCFSAANWASVSDAKSSGVTTLRTLSPPPHSPIRLFGIMAARQCPGLRRYVTIENSETFAIDRLGEQILACCGAMYSQTGPKQARTVEDTVSVTIDMYPAKSSAGFNGGTAQVGGYKEASVLQTPNDKNVVTIVGDLQTKSGLRSGTLDRVTGALYLDLGMFDGLPKSFIGTCRPSQMLFQRGNGVIRAGVDISATCPVRSQSRTWFASSPWGAGQRGNFGVMGTLPRGKKLITLRDAAEYITELE
jgi:hypothetical protein